MLEEMTLASTASSTSLSTSSSSWSQSCKKRAAALKLSPKFLRDHKPTPPAHRKSNLQQQINQTELEETKKRDLSKEEDLRLGFPKGEEVNGFSSKPSSALSPSPPPLPPRLKCGGTQQQQQPPPRHNKVGIPPPPLPPPSRSKDLSSYFGLLTEEKISSSSPNVKVSQEVAQAVAWQSLSPDLKNNMKKSSSSPPGKKDLNKFLGIEKQKSEAGNKGRRGTARNLLRASAKDKSLSSQQPRLDAFSQEEEEEKEKNKEKRGFVTSKRTRQSEEQQKHVEHKPTLTSSPRAKMANLESPVATPKTHRRSMATRLFRNPLSDATGIRILS